MKMLQRLSWMLALSLGLIAGGQELPAPESGGPGGKSIALLVVSDQVGPDQDYQKRLTDAGCQWRDFIFRFTVPPDTADLQVWLHSLNAAKVEAYLDELAIRPVGR